MKLEREILGNNYIEKFNVLKKIKTIPYLIEDIGVSVAQVADFYEVTPKAISTVIDRNRSELEDDGTFVLRGQELKEFKEKFTDYHIDKRTPSLTILSLLAVCRIAFYLNNSDMAFNVRDEIFNKDINLYNHIFNKKNQIIKKYEMEMGFLLISILGKHHTIKEQVSCGNYKIDFVIDGYLAIEVDEYGHSGYDKAREKERKNFIKCNGYNTLMRYDTRDCDMLGFIGDIIESLNKKEVAC